MQIVSAIMLVLIQLHLCMYACVAAELCCAPLFSSFLPHATLQCLLAAVLKGNRWYFVTMLSLVVVAADVVSGL